jgi:hypothetical protein
MNRSVSILGSLLVSGSLLGCQDEPPPAADEEAASGCQKVDILFVIDNSGSMADNQAKLIQNFPGFAQSIEERLGEDVDYNVGVVTSDAYAANAPQCRMLGALVSQTPGADGSTAQCFDAGRTERFLTGEDDLSAQFSCIANVGAGGSASEDPIGAARAALQGTTTGSCNSGFLRPDSLLVLAFLTDEDTLTMDEAFSTWEDGLAAVEIGLGNASPDHFTSKWIKGIAEASQHHPDNTVVLSITTGVAGSQCSTEQDASMLLDYTSKYKYHHAVDLCAPSYGEPLLAALDPVDTACENYEPRLAAEVEAAPAAAPPVVDECTASEPSSKSWIMMLGGTLMGTVVGAVFLMMTLARSLARKGSRQSSANAAAYAGGGLLGGICGVLVAWSHGCGLWGWFGIVPAAIAGVSALLLLIAVMSGRKL